MQEFILGEFVIALNEARYLYTTSGYIGKVISVPHDGNFSIKGLKPESLYTQPFRRLDPNVFIPFSSNMEANIFPKYQPNAVEIIKREG